MFNFKILATVLVIISAAALVAFASLVSVPTVSGEGGVTSIYVNHVSGIAPGIGECHNEYVGDAMCSEVTSYDWDKCLPGTNELREIADAVGSCVTHVTQYFDCAAWCQEGSGGYTNGNCYSYSTWCGDQYQDIGRCVCS